MKRCIFCLSECPDSAKVCPSCGFNGVPEKSYDGCLPLGTRLNGRYVLGGVCSKGKTFTVYYAFDSQTHSRVKISEYLKESLMYRLKDELIIKYYDDACRAKGDREISAFYSHYVKLCGVSKSCALDFTDCFAENSTFYFVCAVNSGTPLSSLIGNGRAMPLKKALSLLSPVIDCAEKLNSIGKWHGSLSPYTIITEGEKTTAVTGYSYPPKSLYSPFDAPEKQLGARQCGSFTDVYAIGAMLYEAATGFIPPNAAERDRGRQLKFPQGFPQRERTVIEKALSLNKDERYQTVAEFSAALRGEKPKEKKAAPPRSEIIRRCVLALAVICLIFSAGVLINNYVIEPLKEERQASELENLIQPTQQNGADPWQSIKEKHPDTDFPANMNPSFAELYAINPEFAGWISIPSLDISYSVLQAEDNKKYLRRDIYGKSTSYGVPFFDYHNSLTELDRNTIIYGHNMRHDDKIFGTLEQYRTVDGFKKAPLIGMSTLYGDYTFKVYAVFITNSMPSDDNGHIFNYIFTNAANNQFMNYVREIDKRKLYSTGVDINENDKIITLSTCCYDFDDARLVVVGRLLREGESADIDFSLARKNENPKFPQAYYDKNRTANPYANDPDEFNY